MKKLILAAALCAATAVAQAAPVQYNFAYDTGIGVLSGSLMGELQTDNNTIFISSMLDYAKFNGVAGPSLTKLGSFLALIAQQPIPPSTTRDGSVQDFTATDVNQEEGFAIFYASASGEAFNFFVSGPHFGGSGFESATGYVPANWSIQSAAAVPEPASLLLMLAGLGLVGLAASRRRMPA